MRYPKYLFLGLALSLVLTGAACQKAATTNTNSPSNTNVSTSTVSQSITYTGQDGKNALDLLTSSHTVEASAEGFVNSIDGQAPVGKQYWAFYVNGKLAEVGAKDYQTKNSDAIEWKLEAY